MKIVYEGDPFEDRSEAHVERFEEQKPAPRPRSNLGSNADQLVWEYDSQPNSRWFDRGELIKLDPGEYTDFQSHRPEVEGDYELSFRVFYGSVALRTEYWDAKLERFDTGVVPAGAAYQFGNIGTDPVWIGTWATVGTETLREASTRPFSERPGAETEYHRILANRHQHDLSAPPVDYGDNPDEGRPEVVFERFSEIKPAPISLAPEVGNNAARTDWFTGFAAAKYFSHNTIVKMEPGEHLVFHSHFENEGPYEEVYWIMEGEFTLRTEYWDTHLDQFDFAYLPTGCAHSVGNVGTDTAWFVAYSTQGGTDRDANEQGVFDVVEPKDRESVVEEYKRIVAARKKRGLSIPSYVDVEIKE